MLIDNDDVFAARCWATEKKWKPSCMTSNRHAYSKLTGSTSFTSEHTMFKSVPSSS